MTQAHGDNENDRRVYSELIRAGQRTYFFDVKVNRNNQCYLVITESKKRIDSNGNPVYDKFKIHLYRESFFAFSDLLEEVGQFMQIDDQQEQQDDDS